MLYKEFIQKLLQLRTSLSLEPRISIKLAIGDTKEELEISNLKVNLGNDDRVIEIQVFSESLNESEDEKEELKGQIEDLKLEIAELASKIEEFEESLAEKEKEIKGYKDTFMDLGLK